MRVKSEVKKMKVEVVINDELYKELTTIVKIQGRNFSDVVNDALHREYEHLKQNANFEPLE